MYWGLVDLARKLRNHVFCMVEPCMPSDTVLNDAAMNVDRNSFSVFCTTRARTRQDSAMLTAAVVTRRFDPEVLSTLDSDCPSLNSGGRTSEHGYSLNTERGGSRYLA